MYYNTNKPIKLLLVDDHPLVRRGVTMCLSQQKNMEVVGETGEAQDVMSKARDLSPDVILMDIVLPEISGFALTSRLRDELPGVRVLILSTCDGPASMRQAIRAGAVGYIHKGAPLKELLHAVETVYDGETYFNSAQLFVSSSAPVMESDCEKPMGAATQIHPAAPPAVPPGPSEPSGRKPTVLVMEDDPYSSAFIWTLLNQNNFAAASESSGLEGLQQARNLMPDIIVLDVNLPGINGLEICRRLKADPKTSALPIVFCSRQSYLASEAMELGAAAFLEKPGDITKLPGCLRQILSSLHPANPAP